MERSPNQVQQIAERLLSLCANAVGLPGGAGQQVLDRCGDIIIENYDAFARVAADAVPGKPSQRQLADSREAWLDRPASRLPASNLLPCPAAWLRIGMPGQAS
jgi:hypothetical protein